jgi:hypothetical protein
LRNTTYGQFKQTSMSFFQQRPNTGQASRINNGSGLADGNILSDIENISEQELRERLVVAEMIMKKLYAKNKDLELGINRA